MIEYELYFEGKICRTRSHFLLKNDFPLSELLLLLEHVILFFSFLSYYFCLTKKASTHLKHKHRLTFYSKYEFRLTVTLFFST